MKYWSVSDNKRCAVTPQDRVRIRADLKRKQQSLYLRASRALARNSNAI